MDTENEDRKNESREREFITSKEKTTWIPIRFLVAFLAFIGFTFNYMLRVKKSKYQMF